jgi:hypothetical protein
MMRRLVYCLDMKQCIWFVSIFKRVVCKCCGMFEEMHFVVNNVYLYYISKGILYGLSTSHKLDVNLLLATQYANDFKGGN